MKLYLKFIKHYLNFLSFVAPKYGGKVAVTIFQKVRIKKIKRREAKFYETAKHFRVKREGLEDLHCYEMGDPNGKLVFLVHGWDSNAGSLSRFATELASKNFRVISFDLPAHTNTKETHTNLYVCKEALKTLIVHINPTVSFNVISHSFGSSLTSYVMAETDYKFDKIVFLSVNNSIETIFRHFQKLLGFNERIYNEVNKWVVKIIKEDLSEMIIANKLKLSNFKEILIIHDKFDKVIGFNNAEEIHKAIPNTVLKSYEKIGHYRMLWNENVVSDAVTYLSE